MFHTRTALCGLLAGVAAFSTLTPPQAEARDRRHRHGYSRHDRGDRYRYSRYDRHNRYRYSRHDRYRNRGYYSYGPRYYRYSRPVVVYRNYDPYYYDYAPRYRYRSYYSSPGVSISFGGHRHRYWR